MAVPLIYSCWEGFFKTATTKCLIVIRDKNLQAKDATPQQRALWLKRASFFNSYIDMLRNVMDLDADIQASERHAKQKSKVKKGQHTLLAATLEKLDNWHAISLDKAIEPESLILTFSNINRDVVDLNAAITGLDALPLYNAINFSQLEALVGKRNSIG
ncbi:MAG: MAE_28990/MAE_18760 family HEPN-like nuclease, partial [Candidatus Sungbacteria bacterium]|nr:MAE_28990/MAE_18760 family HEPN-like nuclease [Candidatus Sungbacteria bacterium]